MDGDLGQSQKPQVPNEGMGNSSFHIPKLAIILVGAIILIIITAVLGFYYFNINIIEKLQIKARI